MSGQISERLDVCALWTRARWAFAIVDAYRWIAEVGGVGGGRQQWLRRVLCLFRMNSKLFFWELDDRWRQCPHFCWWTFQERRDKPVSNRHIILYGVCDCISTEQYFSNIEFVRLLLLAFSWFQLTFVLVVVLFTSKRCTVSERLNSVENFGYFFFFCAFLCRNRNQKYNPCVFVCVCLWRTLVRFAFECDDRAVTGRHLRMIAPQSWWFYSMLVFCLLVWWVAFELGRSTRARSDHSRAHRKIDYSE